MWLFVSVLKLRELLDNFVCLETHQTEVMELRDL